MSNRSASRLRPVLAAAPGLVLGALALLACQWAGDALVQALGWPVPGAVAGMLLLWAGLCALGRVPRGLDGVASVLLSHLMLPLIPLVAGVSEHGAVLRQHGPALLLLCLGGVLVTTVCAAAAYALAVRGGR